MRVADERQRIVFCAPLSLPEGAHMPLRMPGCLSSLDHLADDVLPSLLNNLSGH